MIRPSTVIRVQGEYLYIVAQDEGLQHPEDRGLWCAYKVTWNWHRGEWHFGDDDVWMTDGEKIIAREIGWDRRREVCGLKEDR